MSNARFGLRTRTGEVSSLIQGLSADQDAIAFLISAGITDETEQLAIIKLVLNLKQFGIWTKMKAIYPFVGGTATSHKFNLKNPQDTNAAYRLSFSGGWTHSANGALPNGTNAFADTFFNPSTLSQDVNSTHLSFYQRGFSDTGTSRTKMGASIDSALNNNIALGFFQGGAREVGTIAALNTSQYAPSGTSVSSQGLFVVSTNGSRDAQHYIQGNTNGGSVLQSGVMPNFNIHIGRLNNGGSSFFYGNKECAFASIGDGLTTTEVGDLYTAVETFQITLNRNV